MEATKEMLHDQDLPMHLWEELAWKIVYVQNHTPHRVQEETIMGTSSHTTSRKVWCSIKNA